MFFGCGALVVFDWVAGGRVIRGWGGRGGVSRSRVLSIFFFFLMMACRHIIWLGTVVNSF